MNDLERDLRSMFAMHEADLSGVRFAPAPAPPEVRRRVRRRQVGVVVAGFLVAVALATGVVTGASALLRSSERRVPANPTETPTPAPVEAIRPETLDSQFSIAAATGEVDGVRWTLWATDDLSSLAFTSVGPNGGSGDYSGMDAGYENGYDGSDLGRVGICVYACPAPDRPIPHLYGVVSERVASVEFVSDDGTTFAGTIHPRPPNVTVDARAFTVQVDQRRWGGIVGTLRALASDGAVLKQVRYPSGADGPAGASIPITIEATLASGMPTSAVDGRPSEQDRWEIAIWRNAAGEWCLGTIYPFDGRAVVASEGSGCAPREGMFDGIRRGAIAHVDVWWIDESSMFGENARWFRYRVVGMVPIATASVRIELEDGQVVEAELYDPPAAFEDMGQLFVAEFRSRLHPFGYGGAGGISWRAVALGASGEVLGSDEIAL